MIDQVIDVDGIAVQVHVDDREAGDGCFAAGVAAAGGYETGERNVAGAQWCLRPGARYLLHSEFHVGGEKWYWDIEYDKADHFESALEGLRAAVRRALARHAKRTEKPQDTEKGTKDA